uniref:3 transmembrane helices protein n=1 Tax=Marseillevirus LCMAC102 TaxID=2506603 RepID=A0A481YVP7_9VIRU|nr:MAG: 3 transmembrane helices protein [Marseillevirus LCMAC102]
MWIYVIVVIIILYAVYKERQALGCSYFFNGKDCDNSNGKAVEGSHPFTTDNTSEILDKIKYAAAYQDRFVKWRSFLIVSFLMTGLIWFIIYKKMPSEWELVVFLMVLFLGMSLSTNFYRFHLSNHIEHNIDESVEILRQRLNNFLPEKLVND